MSQSILPHVGTRRITAFAGALVAALATAALAVHAQVPGPNVNMVSGTSMPEGDPFLQRQNEPSGAVSTRNPLHIMAGANDYRTVDLPGLPDGEETGDAWLGVYKSFDGGQSWRSTLIPGYPQDKTTDGLRSPLHAYQAGADPTVRAGTNGLFYYSGIAFNRGTNGLGVLFLSRFVDDNNAPGKDSIRFLGTSVVASGTKNQFIDKPYMVVDVPRPGAKMCSIPVAGQIKQQLVAAGTIYISYVVFDGTTKFPHSRVMLTRSTDCGVTWSRPSKVSEGAAVNQGVALAVDPNSGEVYLAWRQFANTFAPMRIKDGIVAVHSRDVFHRDDRDEREYREPMEFSDPVMVSNGIQPFDQGDSITTFRTNSYPTIAIDAASRVYLAWTERGWGPPANVPPANPAVPVGDARIVMTTSTNGVQWTAKQPIEPSTRNGHQIMPVLTAIAGKISAVYYDLREDVAGVFGQYVDDGNSKIKRHTLDVRVLQAPAGANAIFEPSVQVSRYLTGSLPGEKGKDKVRQLQFNVPNLPLYRLGTTPFIGDFIDIAGQTFVQDPTGKWTFNVAAGGPAFLHAFWTDNRDVRPPKNKDWTKYTPPTTLFSTVKCEAGTTGMRNSNIYTSLVTPGLRVGSPSNSRRLDPQVQRSFVVFAQNNTAVLKRFRMRITNQPPGGRASFMQFDPLTDVDVNTPPRSTGSRTVFVTSSDPTAKINVDVIEVEMPAAGQTAPPPVVTNGLRASIALNPDVTNPDVTNPDVTNAELLNPDVTNPDVTNPDVTNPDVTNPDVTNPDVTNAVVANPDVTNPDVTNPDVTNPDVTNPDVTNTAMADGIAGGTKPIDATWTVTNKGTVAGSFAVKPFIAKNAPAGTKQQVILHKSYKTPVTVGDDCTVKTVTQLVLVSNITDPNKLKNNPGLDPADESNGTIWLEPGQSAKVTLRVLPPAGTVLVQRTVTQSDGVTKTTVFVDPAFDPGRDVAPVIQQIVVPPALVAQGITTPPPPTSPLVITTTALANGLVTRAYDQPLVSAGGVGARAWSVVASSDANIGFRPLPSGLALDSATGRISGVAAAAGFFPFTVQVTDSATPPHVNTQDLTINIAPFALAQSVTTPEDVATAVTLGAAGVDNSVLAFSVTQPPSHGLLSGTPPSVTYTPAPDYFGPDSFAFAATLSTPAGPSTSQVATVSLNITAVNDPPVAGSDNAATAEDTTLSLSVATLMANDSPGPNESDQTLSIASVQSAANTHGQISLNSGIVTFVPEADYNGQASFDYVLWDNGTSNGAPDPRQTVGHVFITVTEVNDPPVAVSDTKSVLANTVLSFPATDLTANDTAGPANESGQLLTVDSVTPTLNTHGTVALNAAAVTYTPEQDYFGPASFTYNVCDNGTTNGIPDPKCATGTVNVTVGQPLTITTLALPNGTQGGSYSQRTFATGGLAPYTWSIVPIPNHPEFDVPTGLTFATQADGTGLVSGIPTIALQVRTFRLQVADARGDSRTQDVCVHIDETSISGLIANPASATDVAAALVGESVTISNVTYAGAGAALGTFSGGLEATGLSSGIVLSSGWVANIDPPNSAPNTTAVNGSPGDADLGALSGGTTYDAAVLEFDFVVNDPGATVVKFDYVFASEEYNEFANTAFNDVFGFFLSGPNFPKANLALIPGTSPPVPVSINNINGGNPLGTSAHHADLFIDNPAGSTTTQADGLTNVLTLQATVTPGQTYHLKIAIADVGDRAFDSWVLIKAHSLSAVCPLIP